MLPRSSPRNGRKNGGRKSIGAVVSSCGGLRQSRFRPPRKFWAETGWAMEVGLSGALNLKNLTLSNPISLKPCDSKAFRRLKELPMQQNSLKSLRALAYVIQPRRPPPRLLIHYSPYCPHRHYDSTPFQGKQHVYFLDVGDPCGRSK